MVSTQTVYLRLPSPLKTLTLNISSETTLAEVPIPACLRKRDNTYLRTASFIPSPNTPISSLCNAQNPSFPITLDLCARLQGGKGGFGSQLRAAGGRMSSGKNTNTDSCRDLSGRRLSTIKEAQRQAELLESAPALRAQAVAAEKAKLEGLERSLGISSEGESSSSGSKRLADLDLEQLAQKKHKFDDNAYLEESREINDNVRSAVSAGLLKKKKKKAATGAEASKKEEKVTAAATDAKKVEKDKIAMPPPSVTKASSATAA